MASESIYRLPPYRVEAVVRALAETIDWGLSAYGIPDMWKLTRGRGIRVAVLDTGMDEMHPDLQGTVVAVRDFSRSVGGTRDTAGHGTHVAGVIAARQNDIGVVGICPDLAEGGGGLLIGKVLGDDGAGLSPWIVDGVDWAVSQRADIISMSLGSSEPDMQIQQAIVRGIAQGVFVICAAGNNGRDNSVDYPGRFPETIAVAAVDRHGRVSSFSSRGPEVDIAAPGQDVLSTYPGDRYAKLSGTSTATPFVTGVVALMLAKHREQGGASPVANNVQLREHLARTARDAGTPGKDPSFGFGLIDPASMLGPTAPPGAAPPWVGLRLEFGVAGVPAVAVLAPRDARVVIENTQGRDGGGVQQGSETVTP